MDNMKFDNKFDKLFRQLEEISLFSDEECEMHDHELEQLDKQQIMQNIFKY